MHVVLHVVVVTSTTEENGGYVFTSVFLSVCLFENKISQKVVDGFGRNLVESLGM